MLSGTLSAILVLGCAPPPPAQATTPSAPTAAPAREHVRTEPPRMVAYEFGLPKPMRFAAGEMRRVRLRLGVLKFDTEFDRHDFTVGLRRAGLLRRALRDGGCGG